MKTARKTIGQAMEASKPHMTTPQEKILAETFAAELLAYLGQERFDAMKAKNQTPAYIGTGACASHDFTDANFFMDAAFVKILGRGAYLLGDSEQGICTESEYVSDCHLWNEAWNYSRKVRLI